MGYDAWKLDPGYDDRENCDHEEYEIDWGGRAHCQSCSAIWTATTAECDAYDRASYRAAEEFDRMQRRENAWWRRLARWLTRPHGIVPNQDLPDDGEIPF